MKLENEKRKVKAKTGAEQNVKRKDDENIGMQM
jgi:hypothetical protein